MHVIVTGAAGFIGYHVCKWLIAEGHKVTGIDNYNDYYDKSLKINRVLKLGVDRVHRCDLNRIVHYKDIFQKADAVIHLAAYAGVRYSMDHPRKYIESNILGTQTLIEMCEEVGIDKVLYASTSSVMAGNPLPWKEDDPTGKSLNPYAASKKFNEMQFGISKIKSAIGLRFFTVYGPWGRPDMALFSFTKNIIEGNPITLFNNGEMKRDFTYIDDIVQGISVAFNQLDKPSKEIYNIGRGEQVDLMDFVTEIEKNLGREAIIQLGPMHPADVQETYSDTTKLQALGYKPKTSIAEGVANFVRWYKDYYKVN